MEEGEVDRGRGKYLSMLVLSMTGVDKEGFVQLRNWSRYLPYSVLHE